MMLAILIGVLLVAGVLAWWAEHLGPRWPRWITLIALTLDLALALTAAPVFRPPSLQPWLMQEQWSWIPRFGITVHLAMDGLSLLLILLSLFLGLVSVAISWREINRRVGFFHFNLLWVLAGTLGVFLSLDLFLFFIFWEVMLVPMYFLVAVWGHEARHRAALKFFIFTQGSGLLMLVAILTLVFLHHQQSGQFSFDYALLQQTHLSARSSFWIMAGFFVAFAVKLPALPFHAWLPDTHTQASTAGSVILAGVLLKTGAYGLIRFVVQFFPTAAHQLALPAMVLAVAGILYGALLAFGQRDVKRLVAYTSISHMGFVLLGIFAGTALALHGAVMQMIAHGLITPALFMVAGILQTRFHSRDMSDMGGLWAIIPRCGAMGMFFAMAALGLPGLAGFVGEFLVLAGSFAVYPVFAVVAALGMIVSVIYALQLVQYTFHGESSAQHRVPDLSAREMGILGVMVILITALGLHPQPVFELLSAAPAVSSVAPPHTVVRLSL
ncbi:MAG: NADH-quinone oxidoreductase subunit M [Gammaproteobacteria bacterium]|jgi:NADH-quinone oxidoreductase subunit M